MGRSRGIKFACDITARFGTCGQNGEAAGLDPAVLHSGFAGYYLGLAKYNRENAGPIVVKGLLIAALVHATYNTLVGVVPALVSTLTGVGWPAAFIAFILVYDGAFGYLLYRKVVRYRRAYTETVTEAGTPDETPTADSTPDEVPGEDARDAPESGAE